jgi:hypothetical protein
MTYWGILEKSAVDDETIEEAIARLLAAYQYFTTVAVWGMLPKSGVDDETIEEAINRLITVHNDDETAHLGTGQSLQSHKASEIIDHLANSIVPDKISSRFATYSNSFVVPSTYDNSGIVEQAGYGRIYAQVTSVTHDSYITPQIELLDGRELPTAGFLWDLSFAISKGGTPSYTGLLSCGDDYVGFGFSINNTGIRAFYAIDGSITYSDYLSISLGELHRGRFFIDPITKLMQVSVDDELLATLDFGASASAMTYYIYVLTHWISGSAGNTFTIILYSTNLYIG